MKRMIWAAVLTVWSVSAYTGDDLSFEVASIKPAAAPLRGETKGCTGGPGSPTPQTWSCNKTTLGNLIFSAYDLELYQFRSPEWMATSFFHVSTKVPAGTTKEQFRKMQQNLLAERFKLVCHWQPKEMTLFELVVDKGGSKLRPSEAGAPAPVVEWGPVPRDFVLADDGYVTLPAGTQGLIGINGRIVWKSANVTIADIVRVLRREMGSDVLDRTGLTGRYDMDMHWVQLFFANLDSRYSSGPQVEKAIQERLGLKLESKKGMVNTFVLDQVEKTPTEN